MNIALLSNIIGMMGVFMVVFAYLMTQIQKWDARDLIYIMFNLVGALFITFSLVFHWNLASFVIEMFWISISLYGLRKYITRHKWQTKKL